MRLPVGLVVLTRSLLGALAAAALITVMQVWTRRAFLTWPVVATA